MARVASLYSRAFGSSRAFDSPVNRGTRGRSGMGETRFKVALVTRLPCEVARAATFQAPPSARESARTRNVRVRGQRVCSSHGGRSASGYRSIWPQRCRGRGPTGKESCGVSMLLAGDAVVVSVEPAVVRSPDVVEPSAALEVRDRVCRAACVVVRRSADPRDVAGAARSGDSASGSATPSASCVHPHRAVKGG